MTRSELIALLSGRFEHLLQRDVRVSVQCITDAIAEALAAGERVEIRGFGSFSVNVRPPRMGRNPRTGEAVAVAEQRMPHFKPGKDLRDAVQAIPNTGTRSSP